MQNLHYCQYQPPTNKSHYQSQSCSPDDIEELFRRVNEAIIFVGDIWATTLINTRVQVFTITWHFCEEHGYKYTQQSKC